MELQDNLARFEKFGADVIGVSVDSTETSLQMSRDLGLKFPLAADTDRRLTKALGIYDPANDIAWPAVFIVGVDGNLEWRDVAKSYVLESRPTSERLLVVLRSLPSPSATIR